ncbi:hypothetical protein M406DRAFT_45171 [Cryphonectria parasitica EP155]|uniref:FAD dependent oxidoreductase domain-containing protein n=1 Tax=Cryphonectria parasitica (strain ATCC 38755 / EP155) TaxID=660469 RepID=A0A9P4Y861_CRYP1|nr:uncharacterized protein M406DRAFT_45171 [Cryphonectria parasitica EP155]KAF3768712.1 hypothetical protein M406DRAFT_45171 [Cryphonectria parasitica EP155]
MATETTILGAGIIGLSTAYYLARHQPPSTIHLVESCPELFASASGYAGGFLARDWFGPGSAPLAALSFDEHRRLAKAHNGAARWSYRSSTAVSYTPASEGKARKGPRGEDWLRTGASRADETQEGGQKKKVQENVVVAPPWLRREEGDEVNVIGGGANTAQLDPLRLCQFLLDECVRLGVHLHHPARALAVMADMRGELSAVRIANTTSSSGAESDIPCARLVIAAGAWSARVFSDLFPNSVCKLPVSSLAGHSLVVRSPRWTEEMEASGAGCHAVFTTSRQGYSPEMFSRAGADIWIGGLNSATTPLPEDPTGSRIEAEAIAQIKKTAAAEEVVIDDLEVVREALCFRPVTPYGTPIISRLDDGHLGGGITTKPDAEGGVFLAAGHGPWGISLSLGTGIVLAEMAQGRKLSADVSSLLMW